MAHIYKHLYYVIVFFIEFPPRALSALIDKCLYRNEQMSDSGFKACRELASFNLHSVERVKSADPVRYVLL